MTNRMAFLLAAGSLLFLRGATASGQEPVAPAYANVEIVSIDPITRIVVIKNAKGARETLEFDDRLSGAAGIKPGDHVMMTVQGAPGRRRIGAIRSVTAPGSLAASALPAARPANADLAQAEMRKGFASQVATLSEQARPIDSVWSSFVTTCAVKQTAKADGGRAWFGLWDGSVHADLSSGFCRDLFNQIVSSGEGIKKAMAAADDVARPTLGIQEVRNIRKLNSMDWDGWTLAAPEKLEP